MNVPGGFSGYCHPKHKGGADNHLIAPRPVNPCSQNYWMVKLQSRSCLVVPESWATYFPSRVTVMRVLNVVLLLMSTDMSTAVPREIGRQDGLTALLMFGALVL